MSAKLDGHAVSLESWFTAYGFKGFEPEVQFHPTRKWRFDWANKKLKIAFEVEGGKWTQGRHQRPHGFEEDCYKYSWAAILGWCVIRATTDMVRSGDAGQLLAEALKTRELE